MKSMITYRKSTQILWLAVVAAMAACYPGPDLGIEDYDTVVTQVAEDAEFAGLTKYFMPDSVFFRPDDGSISRTFDDLILSDIHRNMQQRGYTSVEDPDTDPPDVLVVASVITQPQYVAYLGWPFFGQSLTGQIVYPGVGTRYAYTLGTVAIDMAAVEDIDFDEGDFPMMWSAAISGPLQEDRQNKGDRVTNGIDQAFAQSPYLKPD